MPPVLGPVSPSPTRLWSWAVARGSDVGAVEEGEEARFFADEEFLDHDLGAGVAEGAVEAGVDGGVGSWRGRCDDDALAGGEAVGLDDDRRAVARDVGLGGGRRR